MDALISPIGAAAIIPPLIIMAGLTPKLPALSNVIDIRW